MVAADAMTDELAAQQAVQAVRSRLGTDPASAQLGVEIVSVAADGVEIAMEQQPWMLNGHGILHGAMLFWLGDTAFAFLSEARGVPSVTRQADITFIAPVTARGRLRAVARERARFGRNAIIVVDLLDDASALVASMTVHGTALRTA